jgi:hypothetical protein
VVSPKSAKIVAYRMVSEKASINFRLLASFKKGQNDLVNEAKSKGKKYPRQYHGKETGIVCYVLNHQDGSIYSYENNSKNLKLVEILEFELVNCVIEGVRGNTTEVNLSPGESYLVNLVAFDPEFEWSAKLKQGRYDIKSAY